MKLSIVLIIAFTIVSFGQIPQTISYQGILKDNSGQIMPNDQYIFTFKLYNAVDATESIWEEEKDLDVVEGLFSTLLGDKNPFGVDVKFDTQYWLGIQVGDEPELTQRIPLSAVGYALRAVRADTAKVALNFTSSLKDTLWSKSGDNVYRLDGWIGIGTKNPQSQLHVTQDIVLGNDTTNQRFIFHSRSHVSGDYLTITSDDVNGNWRWNNGLSIDRLGHVGIGVDFPSALFHVRSSGNYSPLIGNGWGDFCVSDAGFGLAVGIANGGGGAGDVRIWAKGGSQTLMLGTADNSDILWIQNEGVKVSGKTSTNILEITGGSDIAEPFEMSDSKILHKGSLVVIDEENPGKLKLANKSYDRCVAGVISGAGGVTPGLTLNQADVFADGQLVALTGKVYALTTTINGEIKPGDLLTTSNIPGHAMKATDRYEWPGAVIGKAMTGLYEDEGLVLVLVNLQ